MAEAAVEHQDDRVVGRLVGADRFRLSRHAIGDARVLLETTRDGAQDVALGQDPREPVIVLHEGGAHVAIDHSLRHFDNGQAGFDGQQVA
jgi:hypothetical protein